MSKKKVERKIGNLGRGEYIIRDQESLNMELSKKKNDSTILNFLFNRIIPIKWGFLLKEPDSRFRTVFFFASFHYPAAGKEKNFINYILGNLIVIQRGALRAEPI